LLLHNCFDFFQIPHKIEDLKKINENFYSQERKDCILIYDSDEEIISNVFENFQKSNRNSLKFEMEIFITNSFKEEISFREFLLKLYEEEIDLYHSNLKNLHDENKIKITPDLYFFNLNKFNSTEIRIQNLIENLKDYLTSKESERMVTERNFNKNEFLRFISNFEKISNLSKANKFFLIYSKQLEQEQEQLVYYFILLTANFLKYNRLVYKKNL
jgi:hypothetical protein